MKARIIQYRFGPEPGDLEANFRWILSELDACDDSLDAIVMPEGVDAPAPATPPSGSAPATAAASRASLREKILLAAAATARQCQAAVFANVHAETPTGIRNRTFAYGPDGELAGFYDKQNLTPGGEEVCPSRSSPNPRLRAAPETPPKKIAPNSM